MDFSSFRRCLWKAVRYLASLIPGLLVIGGFVYVYVILQWDLVTHSGAYWTLVGCTVAFSSWCSLLESALMTINSEQFVLSFQAKATQLASQLGPKNGENPSAEYIKARHALDAEVILVAEASERNAPIVVLNHLSTVLLVALLPISLDANQARCHCGRLSPSPLARLRPLPLCIPRDRLGVADIFHLLAAVDCFRKNRAREDWQEAQYLDYLQISSAD